MRGITGRTSGTPTLASTTAISLTGTRAFPADLLRCATLFHGCTLVGSRWAARLLGCHAMTIWLQVMLPYNPWDTGTSRTLMRNASSDAEVSAPTCLLSVLHSLTLRFRAGNAPVAGRHRCRWLQRRHNGNESCWLPHSRLLSTLTRRDRCFLTSHIGQLRNPC
jgi:hypothetical protein